MFSSEAACLLDFSEGFKQITDKVVQSFKLVSTLVEREKASPLLSSEDPDPGSVNF